MITLLYRILSTLFSGMAILKRIESDMALLKLGQLSLERNVADVGSQVSGQGEILNKILTAVTPSEAAGFVFSVELEGQITEGATSISMTNSQQATATIQPVDSKGNPAAIDTSNGGPTWASSDETIVTVEPATDGLSAVVKAVGPLGSAKVSVTGDADLGPEHKAIFGEIDVTVTQGQAVGLKITLGEATEQ